MYKDIWLSRSSAWNNEKRKRTYQRPQPQLRERPALESGCRIFGTAEIIYFQQPFNLIL